MNALPATAAAPTGTPARAGLWDARDARGTPGTWRRIIGQALLALGLVGLLGGCSAIRLGYSNAPTLSYWWLDGYLDFTDAQAPRVRADLAALHTWHKREELPRWLDLLARMEKLAATDMSPQQACNLFEDMRERLTALGQRAEDALATTALELQAEQLTHLERKYQSMQRDFRRDWLEASPERVRERRLEQAVKRVDMIYGAPDERMRALLAEQVASVEFDGQRVMREIQRRHGDFVSTLRRVRELPAQMPAAAAREQARAQLRALLGRIMASPDPAHRAYQLAQTQANCRGFAAVHNAASPEQRQAAARRLRAYQRDFKELAGDDS